MTATPHKGDPENFCLFLSLLDKDVYGDIKSLEEAMRRKRPRSISGGRRKRSSPFPTPTPERSTSSSPSGRSRHCEFDLDGDEFDFYDDLTRYVEDQSIRASSEDAARGRAIGFTMAMLQRRMASTIYAVRRTPGADEGQAAEDPRRPRGLPRSSRSSSAGSRRLRRAARGRAAGNHRPARRRGRLGRPGRPPGGDRAASSKLIDQARGLEKREDRDEAHAAEERSQRRRASSPTRTRSSSSSPSTRTRSTSSSATARTAGRSASSASGASPSRRSTAG